ERDIKAAREESSVLATVLSETAVINVSEHRQSYPPTGLDRYRITILPISVSGEILAHHLRRSDGPESFPLDGARRLRCHVVDHAIDAPHLVDDAGGGAAEKVHVELIE